MAKKITGTVIQFGTKGYGFIKGDNDKKYFVHRENIFNQLRLKVGTKVIFNPQQTEKGLVATKVKLKKSKKEAKPLTDNTIKLMFLLLLVIQIITMYKVFV